MARKSILRALVLLAVGFFALICCQVARADEPTSQSKTKTLHVAIVSSHSRFCDVSANQQHFKGLIAQAANKGARLVCFPELSLMSYTIDKAILKVAEPIPGPSTKFFEEIAREHNLFISLGMAEKTSEKDGAQHYIAQVLIGPDGYLGKYRKYHPTGGEERCGFSPGKKFPTWDIDGFKFGINICFDGRHQDTIQAMKSARVDVIHHPHGNGLGLGRDSEEWTRGKMVYFVPRATTARAYILINNSAGDIQTTRGLYQFGSGALVLDPLGQVVNRTTAVDRKEKMIFVTLKKPLSQLVPSFELKRFNEKSN